MMQKIIAFVKEAIIELKKVSWPTKEEVISSTIIVVISIVLISIFLGLLDFLLSQIIKMVIRS